MKTSVPLHSVSDMNVDLTSSTTEISPKKVKSYMPPKCKSIVRQSPQVDQQFCYLQDLAEIEHSELFCEDDCPTLGFGIAPMGTISETVDPSSEDVLRK